MPQDDALERAKRKLAAGPKVPRAPEGGSSGDIPLPGPPPPPPEKSISPLGFAENVLNDGFELLKGLYSIIPSTYRAGKYIAENLSDLPQAKIGKAIKGVVSETLEAAAEPYTTHGLAVGYHRPVTLLLDAFTLATLGAGSVAKGASIAKAAARPGSALALKAAKLEKAAKTLQRLPGKLVESGVTKAVRAATGGKWDLAKRKAWVTVKREIQGDEGKFLREDVEAVGKKVLALDTPESALFHKARVFGGDAEFGVPLETLRANPKVVQALVAYRRLVKQVHEPGLARRNLLTPAQAEHALAKKFAAEAYGDISPKSVALAAQKIQALKGKGKLQPTWGPAIFKGEASAFSIVDDMVQGVRSTRAGRVGRLEEFKGAAGAEADPRKYVPIALKAYRRHEAKLRLFERTLEEPGLIAARGPGGESFASDLSRVETGTFAKYFQDKIRAQAASHVTDPTIRRLLRWEYVHTESGLIRLYDRFLSLFRASATVANPAWYTGNAVGDAVLGTMAGANLKLGKKFREAMPPEVLQRSAGIGGPDWMPPKAQAVLETAYEIGGAADEAWRAGVIAKGARDDFVAAGLKFEASEEGFGEALRATQDYGKIQVEMRLLEEAVARKSPTLRKKDLEVVQVKRAQEKAAVRVAAIERDISEAERRTGGVSRMSRVSDEMDRLRDVGTHLDRLYREAKAGSTRALTASEEGLIISLMGPETVPLPAKAGRLTLEEAQARAGSALISPEFGLVGRPGVSRSKELAAQAGTLKGAIRGLRTKYESLRQEGLQIGRRGPQSSMNKILAEARIELDTAKQRVRNVEALRDDILADLVDDHVRAGHLEAKLPGLREKVAIIRKHVDRSNAFFGEYLGLDGFEQNVMRRIVPFYPWMKAMTMLAYRLPFIAPVRSFMWHRYAMTVMSLTEDPDLPEYARDHVPILAREDGSIVWFPLGRFSPFGGTRVRQVGGLPIPNMFMVPEVNPAAGFLFSMFGGETIWDTGTLPYGSRAVTIATGERYEHTGDGAWRETSKSPPIISELAHLFPTVNYLESIFAPSTKNRYDWLGVPRPHLNPDGSIKYPTEWWQRLGNAAGIKFQTRTRESWKRGQEIEERKVLAGLRKQFYKAQTPDERNGIRETIRDFMQEKSAGTLRIAAK